MSADETYNEGVDASEEPAIPPGHLSSRLRVAWSVARAGHEDEFRPLGGGRVFPAQDGSFTSVLTETAGAPGAWLVKAELWGGPDARAALQPTLKLTGTARACTGQLLQAHAAVSGLAKEIWPPAKVHEAGGRIPNSAWCTPDLSWNALLAGPKQAPPLETLENLLRVATLLQRYKDTLLESKPITVLAGWKPLAAGAKPDSSDLQHAAGLAIDFKVKATRADAVQKLLDPYHPGGLEFAKGYTHIDLRDYVARLGEDSRFERLYPPDCETLPKLTDEEIIAAFGRVFKTRRVPAGALPPNCTCPRRDGDPSRMEPKQCLPVADCRCLRPLPEPQAGEIKLAEELLAVEVNEDATRRVTVTYQTEAYATIPLIQDAVGAGAHNLKTYAFHGAFIGRSALSGVTMVSKRGDRGFAEEWIVKIPVLVEVSGDFAAIETSSYEFSRSDVENYLFLASAHQSGVLVERVRFAGFPPSIGPASAERLSNTAGDGEARGERLKRRYTFAGTTLTYNGRPEPEYFVGPGVCSISYNYRVESWLNEQPQGESSAAIAFNLRVSDNLPYANGRFLAPGPSGEPEPVKSLRPLYGPVEAFPPLPPPTPGWRPSYFGKSFTIGAKAVAALDADLKPRLYAPGDAIPAGSKTGDPVVIPAGAAVTISAARVAGGKVMVFADGFGWIPCTGLAGEFTNETIGRTLPQCESDDPPHKTVGASAGAPVYRRALVDYPRRAGGAKADQGSRVRILNTDPEAGMVEIASADGTRLGWTKRSNLSGSEPPVPGREHEVTDPLAYLRDRVELSKPAYVECGGKPIPQGACISVLSSSDDTKTPGQYLCVVEVKKKRDAWTEAGETRWIPASGVVNGWVLEDQIQGRCAAWDKGNYIGQVELVDIVGAGGQPLQLYPSLLPSYLAMTQTAKSAGFDMKLRSGFRDYAEQRRLVRIKGLYNSRTNPKGAAAAGFSNHQDGCAIDIHLNGKSDGLYTWLKAHGPEHGYIRTCAEAWHWERRPDEARAALASGTYKRAGVSD